MEKEKKENGNTININKSVKKMFNNPSN